MALIQFEDNDDEIVRLLEEIRDATQGGILPGQSKNTQTSTTLRVHDVAGKFSPPQNSLNLANQQWEDDKLSDLSLTSLNPGDTQTVARMVSTDPSTYVAVAGVATTEHAADMDNNGTQESVIEYRFEYQTHEGGATWNPLPGMTSTLPLGYLGAPVEVIPGSLIGPMRGFRIQFHNVSKGKTNEITVPADEIGAQIAGIIIRTEES